MGCSGGTSEASFCIYDEKFHRLDERLSILERERAELQVTNETLDQRRVRAEAFEELARLDLAEFWTWEPRRINQMPIRLFGRVRLVASKGKTIGLVVGMR